MNYQRVDYPNGYKKIIKPFEPCPQVPRPPKPDIPPMPLPTPMPMPEEINNFEKPTMPPQPTLNLFPVDEGYINGTIYRGLYRPYKNHTPIKPDLSDDRTRMLFNVNKYNFAMTELQFYLNNFPDDQEALRIFNNYRREYLKARDAYESKYGALSIFSNQLERSPWNWVETMAPWKRGV